MGASLSAGVAPAKFGKDEDNLKNDINELIYSKCSRREKRSYEECKKHIKIIHAQDRSKLAETIDEDLTHFIDERIQQVRKQLRTAGYSKLSKVWSEPWNPRQVTEQESRQMQQRSWSYHIQRAQLENECLWEMRNLDEN